MTWDDHKKNFARLARDGGYTIAQYAAEFNLNPNTARRYLRAFKEDTRTADSRKPNDEYHCNTLHHVFPRRSRHSGR